MKRLAISNVIKELGIPANLKGYRYIVYGVELLINDINLIDCTMGVYKAIAEHFETSASRAERAIRVAIETGWDRANIDLVTKMFGYSVDANKGRPTNGEFLATVADYMIMTGGAEE